MDSATTVQMNNVQTIDAVGLVTHDWLNLLADDHLRKGVDLSYT
jgi:hypothetical protein